MRNALLVLGSLLSLAVFARASHWAVIVAGSNGYDNYRHQADACHAYQILTKHGVPKNQIITFMYDDIANSPENPTPGIVINQPNGPDVYKGVHIDYKGDDVTPQNFLKVLKGDSSTGKPVLKSGPNDHVFIYFTDHGAPGLVAFPNDELMATDFISAIKTMNQKKMYKQMAIYIEACESGSMFDKILPKDTKVFGTTAANPDEPSYACYWDDERSTYLGDVYSVNWLEDSDKADLNKESLLKQFQNVKKETNTSHVMQYGDATFDTEPIGEFQGNTPDTMAPTPLNAELKKRHLAEAVNSRDAVISTRQRRLAAASHPAEKRRLQREITAIKKARDVVDMTFHEIITRATGSEDEAMRVMELGHANNRDIDFECYNPLVKAVTENCFKLAQNEWAMHRLHTLVTLCAEKHSPERLRRAVVDTCRGAPTNSL